MITDERRKALRKAFPAKWWTIDADGRVSLGRVLDAPEVLPWLPAAKACTRCKQPAWTGTPRGRAEHPNCGGLFDRLTDQATADVLWMVLRAFPGTTVVDEVER